MGFQIPLSEEDLYLHEEQATLLLNPKLRLTLLQLIINPEVQEIVFKQGEKEVYLCFLEKEDEEPFSQLLQNITKKKKEE